MPTRRVEVTTRRDTGGRGTSTSVRRCDPIEVATGSGMPARDTDEHTSAFIASGTLNSGGVSRNELVNGSGEMMKPFEA
jgi:hypothetical protein